MSKKLSLTSLIAMTIFMAVTFATSQTQNIFSGADKFGFPFVFFSASTNGEIITDTSFSLIGLVGNLAICFGIAYAIVAILSLLKIEKNNTATA